MKNYTEMTREELMEACKAREIKVSSNMKPETLIARLIASDENADAENHGTEMNKEDEAVKINSKVCKMRSAIAAAHQTGNKKAIVLETAIAGGATEEDFQQWIEWVQNLRDVTVDYVVLKHKQSTTEAELKLALGRIYPAWRTILKVGEENKLHKNMFIRKDDVSSIVGYAETFITTTKGTAQTVTSKLVFRKQIEALLGCRMAGNAVLKDADRETLQEYYSAQNTLKNAEKRLNGVTSDKGEHTPGILDTIKATEKNITDGEKMLRDLGINEEEISKNPLLAGYRARLKDLLAQKKQAEDSKKKANETIKKLSERVEQIENTLNEIEL